jgi:hypothetical protein
MRVDDKNLLHTDHGFCTLHGTTFEFTRLTDYVTLNFSISLSTAAVFLDVEKGFGTTWHPDLLYKLAQLQFSASIIKLISAFLSGRTFGNSFEGELSTALKIQAGVPQGFILRPYTVHFVCR